MSVPPELLGAPPPGLPAGPPPGPDSGGPPGPDSQVGGPGGLPPDLMAMIDQHSQGGPDTPGPVDASAGVATPGPGGGPNSDLSPVEALRNVISALEEYQAVEHDDIDLAEAAKVYALVQKLLAKNQSETEAAAGITPVHKGLAKAQLAGAGY